jgi:ESF2/ABP1 family protein
MAERSESVSKRGIVYVGHVPEGMQPVMIRQLLSAYGEVTRIFFKPRPEPRMVGAKEEAAARRKRRSRHVLFREGWVEFANKKLARLIAEQLHQTPMGVGKQRKKFYATSLWNLSYLSKVRWEHLTDKFEVRTATRVKRVRNEMATAKREIADIDDALRKRRRKQAEPPSRIVKSRHDNDDDDEDAVDNDDNDDDDDIDEDDFARQIEKECDDIAALARTVQPSATQLNSVRDATSRTVMPDKLLKML